MSEILAVVKMVNTRGYWLILACGHWYKWTGEQVPVEGQDFPCPNCRPLPKRVDTGHKEPA